MSTQSRRNPLLTIFLTVFIDMLGIGLIIPIIGPLFLESDALLGAEVPYETRTLLYGLMVALASVAQFFGGPIWGSLSDKIGRKPVLLSSLVVALGGYACFSLGFYLHSLPLLLLGRTLAGFAAGNMSVVNSAIADSSLGEEKAKNFGAVGVAFGMGFIFGPMLGGVLSDSGIVSWFSALTPMLFATCLVVLNMVVAKWQFPETLKHPNPEAKVSPFIGIHNLRRASKQRDFRALFLSVFFYSFAFSLFTQFIQVYLIKRFSFGEQQIGYFFGAVGVCSALTQGLIVRKLSAYYRPVRILSVTLLAVAVGYLGMLVPSQAWALYLFVPFYVLPQAISFPNMVAAVSDLSPQGRQGEMLGMQQSVQSLAQLISPLLGGVIVAISPQLQIWAAAVAMATAWALFYFMVYKPKAA